ncbi:MAG: hypothetical protein AAGM38_08640 [Pseudomonadota bacterium]
MFSAPKRSAFAQLLQFLRGFSCKIGLFLFVKDKHLGIPIGYHYSKEEFELQKLKSALDLIAEVNHVYIELAKRHLLGGVMAHRYDYAPAWWVRETSTCFLGSKHVEESDAIELSLSIIHELSHARLEHRGFVYAENRLRSEEICVRRELSFARRLMSAGRCTSDEIDRIQRTLETLGRYYSTEAVRGRERKHMLEVLRRLKQSAPRCVRRVLVPLTRRRFRAERAKLRRSRM